MGRTAKRGNRLAALGMLLATAATAAVAFQASTAGLPGVGVAVGVGVVVGAALARSLPMTAMPELVALLNSFGGLAAVLIGVGGVIAPDPALSPLERDIHLVECWIGVVVGAVTFTGSVVAWGKLRGTFSGRPIVFPGRHLLNLAIAIALVAMVVPFLGGAPDAALRLVLIASGLASLLGVLLVLAIGGADMPVVVSLLNSYSGWAAAMTGFVLQNDLLIVTGALVGSSGWILTIIMCRAMNRSITNVVFGGFGTDDATPRATKLEGEVREIDAAALGQALRDAKEVVVVPGYGMATARAQHTVKELTERLAARGVRARFAIHPVAGRLPGHMNVLLAEAGVHHEIVLERDAINDDFTKTDVVLVIGANDIVNPSALDDPQSPIAGMPVLHVWEATLTVVFKRSLGAGYAGVDNPLFLHERTRMLFGDAKKSADALLATLGD